MIIIQLIINLICFCISVLKITSILDLHSCLNSIYIRNNNNNVQSLKHPNTFFILGKTCEHISVIPSTAREDVICVFTQCESSVNSALCVPLAGCAIKTFFPTHSLQLVASCCGEAHVTQTRCSIQPCCQLPSSADQLTVGGWLLPLRTDVPCPPTPTCSTPAPFVTAYH